MAQKVYLKWSYKSDLIKSRNCCIAHLSRIQNHWQPGSKECNMFFLKMNPFVISIFFMLFSFDTAWQKSGGASAPPGPPGFDATGLPRSYFWIIYEMFWDLILTWIHNTTRSYFRFLVSFIIVSYIHPVFCTPVAPFLRRTLALFDSKIVFSREKIRFISEQSCSIFQAGTLERGNKGKSPSCLF